MCTFLTRVGSTFYRQRIWIPFVVEKKSTKIYWYLILRPFPSLQRFNRCFSINRNVYDRIKSYTFLSRYSKRSNRLFQSRLYSVAHSISVRLGACPRERRVKLLDGDIIITALTICVGIQILITCSLRSVGLGFRGTLLVVWVIADITIRCTYANNGAKDRVNLRRGRKLIPSETGEEELTRPSIVSSRAKIQIRKTRFCSSTYWDLLNMHGLRIYP